MAPWYSPCLGPCRPQKGLWVQTQWWWLSGIAAPVWDHGTSKRFLGSNPRVMALWCSPCLRLWDLKKCSRFKPKGDGSMAYSPCLGLDDLKKGFGFKPVLVGYLLLDIPNRQGIFKKFTCDTMGDPACTIFFNKLKPSRHRHRLYFFYKMSMGNRYQNWWCPRDLNPGMCIKKYDHNSYGFQAKIK